jgi:hypothetical protein
MSTLRALRLLALLNRAQHIAGLGHPREIDLGPILLFMARKIASPATTPGQLEADALRLLSL